MDLAPIETARQQLVPNTREAPAPIEKMDPHTGKALSPAGLVWRWETRQKDGR